MKGLIWLLLLSLLAQPLWADTEAIRFLSTDFSKKSTANYEDDRYLVVDSSSQTYALSIGARSTSGWGYGYGEEYHRFISETTFKQYNNYTSGTDERIRMRFFNLSYSFGKDAPLTLGYGYLLGAESEIIYSNPACSQFNRISSAASGSAWFLDWAVPMSGYKILVGMRSSKVDLNFPNLAATYSHSFTLLQAGLEWPF